ncbi:hypothetical protein BDP27DRAFT_1387064 [Rhodocollybia butyracea]|uniref:GPN-loop GTPase 2 n=1 Tax=Rhodocollybia butyracea TaxID=206335 RepID=A0A9P5P1S9_9AGAR|nr:hypothetical protein BDP27DRAFT_1387064 [Rhodocollybia butyracea]
MPFGEIVCGAPGSGKSTYCYGKYQLFNALRNPQNQNPNQPSPTIETRPPIHIVNLDPANDNIPYPCSINITDLITLQNVMDELGLGPNGGMLYCMEYLERNFDWLEERLSELGREGEEKDFYVMFDLPGQVELSTNHDSVKRIVDMLKSKCDLRLAAVHLCDAHYITDASKYISVLLLSLRTMLQLELPHINVLSKIDLLAKYGDLDFNLDFYTEDKSSMLHLTHAVDRATGYVYVPPSKPGTIDESHEPLSGQPNEFALWSSAAGPTRNILGGLG